MSMNELQTLHAILMQSRQYVESYTQKAFN